MNPYFPWESGDSQNMKNRKAKNVCGVLRTVAAALLLHAATLAAEPVNTGINLPVSADDTASSPVLARPAPAPVGAPKPTPITYLPPVSLSETLSLISRAEHALPPPGTPALPADRADIASLKRMLTSCINYLTYRDDLHTSLSDYEWVEMNTAKVQHQPGKHDADVMTFTPPVQEISAISLGVERGDVSVFHVVVYDEKSNKRQLFEFKDDPKLLRHLLPRREVFHLWKRTTISRIDIEYARADLGSDIQPKVIVFGGITEKREYIKTALFELKRTLEKIDSAQWDDARESLLDAARNINDYTRKNRVD